MDLRFEAAAANELYENTKLDKDLMSQKFIGIIQQKILTLDKVNGVSQENKKLEEQGINLQRLAENLIQHFKTSCS